LQPAESDVKKTQPDDQHAARKVKHIQSGFIDLIVGPCPVSHSSSSSGAL
jgi:hypothetical protein